MTVYVAMCPVDFRVGSERSQKTVRGTVFPTNGLALAVQEMFGLDPCLAGAVFAFRAKRAAHIKLLV
ncbi:transposase (plasmid) [Paracoccus liaowanqingii]|uniref:Transposase n=1 Tax=Paracoccus liaowanqingii TaxID=2560053 RepID=A0A4Y5SVU1_9RHOB|nr:transposase [Paracoccus liaowanqingii]QDA36935.1 transposase [Paracoccus liaowanqingii]